MKTGIRDAILEFNRGAQYYNNQQFNEAIEIFRKTTVLFKRFKNKELVLYSYEHLAKSYEKIRKFDEANKCWVFCVIYSLQNEETEKLSNYVERFCKLKYRFKKSFNRRYSSLSTIIKDVYRLPLSCLCEEIMWYQKLNMKEDEEEVINIVIKRSQEEEDKFYLGEGYILMALLEEKKVRLKTVGTDIVDYVLNSFVQSDEQLVDVYKYLKMGIDLVDELDDLLEQQLFSVSLFYYHHGKYRSQIDILNMLRGTPFASRKINYNCYLSRTLISIGCVEEAEFFLKENEEILKENNQNLEEEEEDDIFEITSSSPKNSKDSKSFSTNTREWIFSKIFMVITQGYLSLELNRFKSSKEKLDQANRMIQGELKSIRRASTSNLSPIQRNDELQRLNELKQLQVFYQLIHSLRNCDLSVSIELSHDLLETQKTGTSTLPRYIPRHKLFLAVGDVYEQLGFLTKSIYYYNRGIQSGIYTRSRLGVVNLLLRLSRLEKNRLRFDSAEKYLHVLTCLFDGDNINEPFLQDDLDQIGISYLFFLFERSDFFFKLHQYPSCQDYYSYAMKSMQECHMWKRANCCEVVELCTRAKEYESQIANFDGDVEKARNCLEVILKSPFVPPVTRARILFRLSQSYFGKRYLFEVVRSENQMFNQNDQNSQNGNLNRRLEKIAPSSIPTVTKPTYSVLGCMSYHLGETMKSFYYSNMSMGIRLRHEKLDLIRRKVEEKKKKRMKVPSHLEKLSHTLTFPPQQQEPNRLMKEITRVLPSEFEVYSTLSTY